MTAEFRQETPDDVEAIDLLHRAAFNGPVEARIVSQLRARGRLALSLVAVDGDRLIAHLAFSSVLVDGTDVGAFGLAPVATLREFRRRGIAAELIRRGLETLQRQSASIVVVLGEPSYYHRFGFEPASEHQLTSIYDAGDAFMVLPLMGEPTRVPAGLVTYDVAFEGA